MLNKTGCFYASYMNKKGCKIQFCVVQKKITMVSGATVNTNRGNCSDANVNIKNNSSYFVLIGVIV